MAENNPGSFKPGNEHRFAPGESGNPAGAASKFKPEFVEQARKLAQLGAVDVEMAEFFEIGLRTLYTWRNLHPEFAEATKLGKQAADDRVEASLFRKATGYSFASEKIFCQEGQVVRAATVEHVPPSDTACSFWLKNRRKEDWRDKVDHEHTGKDGGEIMAKVTVDAVLAEMRRLDDEC